MSASRRFSLEVFVTALIAFLVIRLVDKSVGWLAEISPLHVAVVLCVVLLARLIVLRRRAARLTADRAS